MRKKRSELTSRYNKSRKMVAKAQELFENALDYINRAADEFDDEGFSEVTGSFLDVVSPILDGDAPISFSSLNDYLENEGAELIASLSEAEDEDTENEDE